MTILSWRRHYYMARISIFLIMATLIMGMVGCGGGGGVGVVKYSLTMAVAPGGSGTATDLTNASPYTAGTGVNIEATANSGYQFVNWTAPAGTFANANAEQTTFTMPTQNVKVTANFVPGYKLTMVANPVGGGTATDLTNASPYTPGTGVSIKAAANSGYHFVNWTAPAGTFVDVNAAQTTFTMPAQNVAVTANFATDYFQTDARVLLNGPATLPPEERNPCVILETVTNIVMDSVRVDLPDGRSIIVLRYSDVYGPGVDGTTELRFFTCVAGMPVAGGEYIFTALDAAGEPIPGVRNTDIWVGVEPPDPPTDVRAEVNEDGILVSWDESPIIPGSFEPAAVPQLGFYQLNIDRVGIWPQVYGAAGISVSSYLIPHDRANFTGNDRGLSLSEMGDGTYCLSSGVASIAPKGSLGTGFEYYNSDPGQNIIFTIKDGEITIE
jgi:uncharacterized repeat protein (TIGR02543 family)